MKYLLTALMVVGMAVGAGARDYDCIAKRTTMSTAIVNQFYYAADVTGEWEHGGRITWSERIPYKIDWLPSECVEWENAKMSDSSPTKSHTRVKMGLREDGVVVWRKVKP